MNRASAHKAALLVFVAWVLLVITGVMLTRAERERDMYRALVCSVAAPPDICTRGGR